MISEQCAPRDEDADVVGDVASSPRLYKTARRRSLSGSAVPSKIGHRRVNFGLKKDKDHQKVIHNDYDSTDTILSELENMDKSIDSLSSSSGINVSDTCRKSNSSDNSAMYFNDHRRKCHSVSAKMKIKHFLSEHIVRTHPCHHPEYHFHKKDSDSNMSIFNSRNTNPNESDFPEYSSRGSTDTSSSKEVSSPRPPSFNEINLINNSFGIASNILDRIRHINIQTLNTPIKSEDTCIVNHEDNQVQEDESNSSIALDSLSDFPFPEPNPCKLPQVISPSSIAFATKQILNNKPKRQRLAHSISYDPDYKLTDYRKCQNMKRLSHALCPEFIPEKDKWEKKISGYLDTSTPTGATLTAINFGLKRVTETDKFLMFTKSPTSCPNEFLEDGISHVEATNAIYQSLMRHSTCYDVMPDSGKVVIIDSQMQIGRAFNAIEDNIVRASPIWSSEKQGFIALLSVNDLIPLLMHLHQQQTGEDNCCEQETYLRDFSTITVEKCLSVIPRFRSLQSHIVGVTPETNLHAVNVMFNRLHKSMVLVIDSYLSGNPLFLLSGLRTLTYLFYKAHTVSLDSCFTTQINSSKLLLNQHFEKLKPLQDAEYLCQTPSVSSPEKLQFLVYSSSPLIDVLRAMTSSYNCCALIIDKEDMNEGDFCEEYIIKDVITMADILNLVKIQKHRDGIITAAHILEYRTLLNEPLTYRDPVVNCCVNDSIQHLIDIIVKKKASFVLVHATIDEDSATLGILTSHDILSYIDSLPCNNVENHCNISNFQLNKNEKCKKSLNKDPSSKIRSQSDNYSAIRHKSTILDDSVEEIFDIEFS